MDAKHAMENSASPWPRYKGTSAESGQARRGRASPGTSRLREIEEDLGVTGKAYEKSLSMTVLRPSFLALSIA